MRKANDEKRLHEVMGRLDKTFKSNLNEGFEEMIPTDDVEVPVDGAEEMPVEEKSPEEKLAELTAKVDEMHAMLHGEEAAEELPAEPEAGEMGIETGEVNLQEWNFDKKKGDKGKSDDEGKGETPAEEKEDVDEDVNITVTEKKGKTPRSWSSKYWRRHNISDTLKEVVEPDNVDVSTIQMHDTLNPLVWESEERLKPEVRKALLMNAKRFIEFCDADALTFANIILTGSMANYNYNENSDLDVHIILDFDQISENKEFVGDFFKLKKALWADKLPVQIKGHDVEMYFQDTAEPHHSSGTYSLVKDDWIRRPTKKIINIDSADVQLKSADLMNAIEDLEDNRSEKNFLMKHEALKAKIKKLRQSGLDRSGEFSTENLAFKILRNTGYLEKLVTMKNNYLTKELSLNEFIDD
jgi:predicted nucleotidyltransferase